LFHGHARLEPIKGNDAHNLSPPNSFHPSFNC
jgi:hypothetical protein